MQQEEVEKYRKAQEIASEVIRYAKSIIKPGMKLLEIAEKIESKIQELGGKPAFPTNLCINEIAAHFTPSHDDETKASGLLKIDLGVHVDGCIIDTAFPLDLEDNEENKKLIEASEEALSAALKIAKPGIEIWKIGQKIQEIITKKGFSPIRNLSGHELGKYKVHAGITIPNYNNNNKTKLKKGVYAIEPFSTNGQGIIYEGKPSGIYRLKEKKPVRDKMSRKILNFIETEYKTLPFCSRWLIEKFGTRILFSLKQLEQQEILHQYPQLIEKGHGKVSQSEKTIFINDKTETSTKIANWFF